MTEYEYPPDKLPHLIRVVCPVKQAGLREKLEAKRQQMAQEGFETMTYKKSKPVKMRKRILKARLENLHANNNSGHLNEHRRKEGSIQVYLHSEVDGGSTRTRLGVIVTAKHSVENFKKMKDPPYNSGFSFDPRHNDFPSPQEFLKRYGRPDTKMYFISTTDNMGEPENIEKALDDIGPMHFIGGWQDTHGHKYTEATYILHSNDDEEVQEHLRKYNQEAAFTIYPDGKFGYTFNKEYGLRRV